MGSDLVIRPLPSSVLDVLHSNHQTLLASRQKEQNWRREDEQNMNGIVRPPDDEAFLDDRQEGLQAGDLIFSDGFPLIADDDAKTGMHQQVKQTFE